MTIKSLELITISEEKWQQTDKPPLDAALADNQRAQRLSPNFLACEGRVNKQSRQISIAGKRSCPS